MKSIYTFLVTTLFVIDSSTFLNSQSQSINTVQKTGDKLYASENFQEALLTYQECYNRDTLNKLCLLGIAKVSQKLGNLKLAKKSYHLLEENDEQYKDAWRRLAGIYETEENIPKAIKYYTLLNREDTTHFYYFRKLGQLYQKSGLLQDAFKNFAKAYFLNGEDIFAIRGLADIFMVNKQYQDADSILGIGLILDPANVYLNLLRARSLYHQKEYLDVTEILKEIDVSVGLANYYAKLLGYSYMQLDSIDRAIYYLQKSLVNEEDPEYSEYYLGVAFERKNDLESAKYYFERALKSGISSNVNIYHNQLGSIAREKREYKESIHHYQAGYRYERNPVILFYLARLYDDYYKDKSVSIRYYLRYLKSEHTDLEYRTYASQREKFLRNKIHMQVSSN